MRPDQDRTVPHAATPGGVESVTTDLSRPAPLVCSECGFELMVGRMRACPFCGQPFASRLPSAKAIEADAASSPTPIQTDATMLSVTGMDGKSSLDNVDVPIAKRSNAAPLKRWLFRGAALGAGSTAIVASGIVDGWLNSGPQFLTFMFSYLATWLCILILLFLAFTLIVGRWLWEMGQDPDAGLVLALALLALALLAGAGVKSTTGAAAQVITPQFWLQLGVVGSAAIQGGLAGAGVAWLAYWGKHRWG